MIKKDAGAAFEIEKSALMHYLCDYSFKSL